MTREFYTTFEDWWNEIENYGTRGERFYSTFPESVDPAMILWLRAAFECGQSGPQRQIDLLVAGANMVLPRNREHAEAMIRVGHFYLEHNKGKQDE